MLGGLGLLFKLSFTGVLLCVVILSGCFISVFNVILSSFITSLMPNAKRRSPPDACFLFVSGVENKLHPDRPQR